MLLARLGERMMCPRSASRRVKMILEPPTIAEERFTRKISADLALAISTSKFRAKFVISV
jgi:hypothetical protein